MVKAAVSLTLAVFLALLTLGGRASGQDDPPPPPIPVRPTVTPGTSAGPVSAPIVISIRIFHQVNNRTATTKTVRLGEKIRVVAAWRIERGAVSGAGGQLTVLKNGRILLQRPMRGTHGARGGGLWTTLRLQGASARGEVTLRVTVYVSGGASAQKAVTLNVM